ncbi:outer membrane protein OmpA-like peptidoglycan-associated protein [Angulomicrobium tetraedrale]|uniref:Outer membrane protein OmpA-like peptidoglycan-associated protein n=1 Tax=Ancylobacter tetraedralis TaxID=217068 RepID=A0A839ZE01_9HYPH|nr:flagellar motor protein MotB [Ancylobacter tetraedralis]MBB3772938.1 outer membrane protein OmpA-like peptidoglycan-associated protein [Ancylobacter tetraedralis]
MCRWRAWWKGLPFLAVLIAAAIVFARAPIEQTLATRADALLLSIGESWAHARFDGRDAIIEGEALSEEARVKVRAEMAQMFGVGRVDDRTTLLPERRPFTFAAIRDGSKLHLEGYVPSSYARRRIVEAASQMTPGVIVTGAKELVRARGVPAGDFIGMVVFGIQQLARMPAGRITLSDDSFSIEGRAPDFAAYDELEVTVRTDLPVDFKLARFAVLPPVVSPFVWSATREGDGVTLAGYIPLGDARRALLDLVRAAVPGAAISDQLRLADGSPPADGWLKAVGFALSQLGRLPDGKVSLSGTTVAIDGKAPDFAAYDTLAGARRSLPEGYTLTRFAVEPPTVAPFVWGVLRGGNGLRLTGYAPSEDAKRLVLDAIKAGFPGVKLSDEMRIAAGGPPAEAWVNATVFGVGQLAKLRTGALRGNGAALSLSGEALDSAAYTTVQAASTVPPPGGFVLERDVRPPIVSPYVFGLRLDADGLTVSGFYPTPEEHEKLVAAARADLLGVPVNDVSAVAQGAPAGFAVAAQAALMELARLSVGEARFDDAKLRFSGTALYAGAVEQIRSNLTRALPPNFTLELALDVVVRPAATDTATCQKAIDDVLARGTVSFLDGGAAIAPASRGLLDHIAAAAVGCSDAVVEISVRQPGTDDALATERARAVTAYLVEAGISPERLVTGAPAAIAQSRPEGATEAGLQVIVR